LKIQPHRQGWILEFRAWGKLLERFPKPLVEEPLWLIGKQLLLYFEKHTTCFRSYWTVALQWFIRFLTEQCKNLFFCWDFSVVCFAIVLLRSENSSGMCANLCTVAASNSSVHPTRSLWYCLFAPHIYGVVLRAHSVRGEPRIQLNARGEVATALKLLKAVFTTLPFLTLWPTWLNVFGHFKINSVDDWKKPGKNSVQNSQRVYPRNLWKRGDPRCRSDRSHFCWLLLLFLRKWLQLLLLLRSSLEVYTPTPVCTPKLRLLFALLKAESILPHEVKQLLELFCR